MRQISRKAVLLLTWALLAALSAALLQGAQRQSEADIEERFGERANLAARFTETYTRDLLEQERRLAQRELASSSVSPKDFASVKSLFGYKAAVLLDARGRVLRLSPAKASLIGQDLTKKYAHLRTAAAGRTAVSNVVRSAAKGVPIVAFATPFDSRHGRRIFSGAFDVERTPVGAYLRNASPFKSARIYLLDSAGVIVTSNREDLVGPKTLQQADPELARGLARSATDKTDGGYHYASRHVQGAPWRLVVSVPSEQLFQPIHGSRRYVPWIMWLGFVVGGLACTLLVGNIITSRAKLRAANADLDRLARIDALTGLYNRRQMQASLDDAVATAHRHDQSLSVLMIDVDRFKSINDDHGHEAGDEVLRFVASVVADSLRAGDLVGRWGGEEFLAILPSTDRHGAEVVAERVREAVSTTPVVVADQLLALSVSIGAAARRDDQTDTLVAEADTAMYAAKAAGRDGVRVAR